MTKEILNKKIEDITFEDLIHLQKELEKLILEPRENGFVPRTRTGLDRLIALDDEFNEWLKELPYELNFKIWKQKEYNRDKELEEFVDILFFILESLTVFEYYNISLPVYQKIINFFNDYKSTKYKKYKDVCILISNFKCFLWCDCTTIPETFEVWIDIANNRGFSKKEIIEMYISKWKKNIERIKGDWTNGK